MSTLNKYSNTMIKKLFFHDRKFVKKKYDKSFMMAIRHTKRAFSRLFA